MTRRRTFFVSAVSLVTLIAIAGVSVQNSTGNDPDDEVVGDVTELVPDVAGTTTPVSSTDQRRVLRGEDAVRVVQAAASGADPCQTALTGDGPVAYRSCWTGLLTEMTVARGASAALEATHAVGAAHPAVVDSCHDLVHEIGRAAYGVYLDPVAAASYDDRSCLSGYLHGVLEAYGTAAHQTGDLAAAGATITELCAGPVDGRNRLTSTDGDYPAMVDAAYECLHGVGHAAAIIVDDDVAAAVALCDTAAQDIYDRNACAGGTLMEYGDSYIAAELGRDQISGDHGPGNAVISDETADNLCSVLDDDYALECWTRIQMFWGPVYGTDSGAMFARCGTDAGQWAGQCAAGVGNWMARQVTIVEPTTLGRAKGYADGCVGAGSEQMRDACLNMVVSATRKNDLWGNRTGENQIEMCPWVPADAQAVCAGAEDEALTQYLTAGGTPPT